jgi:hypothetical protein
MELTAHQSLAELMSDWSKRQSSGKLMTRKILFISKDKRKNTMVDNDDNNNNSIIILK